MNVFSLPHGHQNDGHVAPDAVSFPQTNSRADDRRQGDRRKGDRRHCERRVFDRRDVERRIIDGGWVCAAGLDKRDPGHERRLTPSRLVARRSDDRRLGSRRWWQRRS